MGLLMIMMVVVVVVVGVDGQHQSPTLALQSLLPSEAGQVDQQVKEKAMWGEATKEVLEMSLPAHFCSVALLSDAENIIHSIAQGLVGRWGLQVMLVRKNKTHPNITSPGLPKVVAAARKVRRRAWCVAVVVASTDPSFLLTFARESRKGRLLVWATQLLVVTSLRSAQANVLLRQHWTFSMMNTMMLNLRPDTLRGEALVHLPYSPGGPRVMGVARWTAAGGLSPYGGTQLFPFKFADFHGAMVPVTALILPPFWKVVDAGAADSWSMYSGRDCLLMKALAQSLNFTFHLDKSSNIDEIMASLEADRVMLSGFRIMLIPQILERVDHTYFIDRATFTFSMAKPTTRPQWQSLYYPLGPWVWLCIFISTVVVSSLMYLIFHMEDERNTKLRSRSAMLETLGILLGHDMWLQVPRWTGARVLLLVWLVLAFVVSTGYRGTLTAFLSVPKYPSRPETMEELAKANVRSVFIQNATRFLKYFQESNIPAYRSVGSKVDRVTTVEEGLQQIMDHKKAYFHERYNSMLKIAEHFTEIDGTTPIYVARQNVIPNYAAWMMPHDAPYKPDVDQALIRIIESGLKEKFTDDMLREAWQEIRLKKREQQQQQQVEEKGKVGSKAQKDDRQKSLSLNHMQGAMWILLLGALLASGVFLGELVVLPGRP